MAHIHSFPPITSSNSRVLILGSVPSKVSLQLNQYYGHQRNLFWDFIEQFLKIKREIDYSERIIMLRKHGIAVWDVIKICTRTSSLDSDIDNSTIETNSFNEFLLKHPKIKTICFNGAKAESVFYKHVLPTLKYKGKINFIRLPSTSPANASIPISVKLKEWKAVLLND